ncbi:MAG: EAL and HDOD domain-containing protein [Phycisphaerales bacterium JB063]
MSEIAKSAKRVHGQPAGCAVGTGGVPGGLLFSRQPVFGPDKELHAYALGFHAEASAVPDHGLAGPAALELINSVGLDMFAGDADLLFPFDAASLSEKAYALLPSERTILSVSLETLRDPSVLESLRSARSDGFRLALRSSVPVSQKLIGALEPSILQTSAKLLIENPDWAGASPEQLGVRLLATQVDDHDIASKAQHAGATLCSGTYYCLPETLKARPLVGSETVRLRLLTEIGKPTLDMEAIEAVFRSDIDLPCGLLRYINSAALGLRSRITSIRHALTLMGAEPMRRWCAVAAIGSIRADAPAELIRTTLVRAKFCENIGIQSGDADRSLDYFLVGLLSTIEALLGIPAQDAIQGIPLHDDVRSTLMGQSGSVFSTALEIVRACECGAWASVAANCTAFGLTHGETSVAFFDAVRWGATCAP